MKKLLSFVALSAMLISPIWADEFGGLDYYEENPLPIIYTQPTHKRETPDEYFNYSIRTMGIKAGNGYTTVEDGILAAIEEGNIGELETRLMASKLDQTTADKIVNLVRQNKLDEAKKLVESGESGISSGSSSWDGGYNYGGGKNNPHKSASAREAAARNLKQAQQDLENARRSGLSKRELVEYERNVKHWRNKMNETGENHSMKPKGNR